MLDDPVVRSSGARLFTASGRDYLDFAHGVLSYQHPRLVREAAAALDQMPLSTRTFFSAPLAELTSRLARLMWDGEAVAYPCNSPSEAMEGALKLALGVHRGRRTVFVTPPDAHHGTTLGAMSVSGIAAAGANRTSPILNRRVADIDTLPTKIDRSVAGVVVEPIQRARGLAPLPRGWLAEVHRACARSGALLIVNETATAFGRLGRWFGWQADESASSSTAPDIIVLGDTLGGCLIPYGAYLARAAVNSRVYKRVNPALHGGTTAGHPLGCRIALAVLDLLESEDVPDRARELGQLFDAELTGLVRDCPVAVADHVSTGLIGALRLGSARLAQNFVSACAREGVWVMRPGGADSVWVAMLPPLLVSEADLREGLAKVRHAIV